MALYWAQGWKKDTIQLGEANLQPLGANVPAFISTLGPNNKQKMLKVGVKFFRPLLLV
jgi:hypothetical protein